MNLKTILHYTRPDSNMLHIKQFVTREISGFTVGDSDYLADSQGLKL
jgi:hypothetical protein